MRVLFVGVDNTCISPLAAALLFQQQDHRSIPDLRVASAGFGSPGRPVVAPIAELLNDRGIDVRHKRSRRLDEALVQPANLVLTTTASITHRVIAEHRGVVSRCFPLVAFCEAVEPRPPGVTAAHWLRSSSKALLRQGSIDETLDLGQPDLDDRLEVFELVDRVMLALLRFVESGWPDSGSKHRVEKAR